MQYFEGVDILMIVFIHYVTCLFDLKADVGVFYFNEGMVTISGVVV
jgi:hypothetical protein